jgi:hypothetical protein
MNLKNSIRKNIQILKEEKKVSLTEEKIVRGRFSVLPKNLNKNSSIQVKKAFNGLFTEIRTLKSLNISQKVINENLISILAQMFDEEGERFVTTVKDKLSEYLQSKLNLTDTEQELLSNAIGNTEMDDVPELFNDPKFLAKKIVQAYSEEFGGKYSMMDINDSQQLVSKLEDRFVEKLQPLMGNVNSKMELKLKDIRDNILS